MLLKCAVDSYMTHGSATDPTVLVYTTTAMVHHNYVVDERVMALVNDFMNPRGVGAAAGYSPLFGDNRHIHSPT